MTAAGVAPAPATGPGARIPLRGGTAIPALGLGVFRSPAGAATQRAVLAALDAGYRHIDTAAVYGNEADVGVALRRSGIPRDEVFVTTKLWNEDHGYEQTLAAFERSRQRLGVDVVDLYLVHWPVPGLRIETWRAMEHLLDTGRARAVGVSNYMVHHLDELARHAEHLPDVNQIELSPYSYRSRSDVLRWCRARGIQVEAYSPLTKGLRLADPPLVAMAAELGVSPAQVLVRWALQHGLVVLPKSSSPHRIAANADVFGFELSVGRMAALDALDENLVTGWDPTTAP